MEQGLYRQEYEHDSCGIGAIVDLTNEPSHETISGALYMLSNMEHRGGRGADPKTGDGAGISIQIPHQFLLEVTARTEIQLPSPGEFGLGMTFFQITSSSTPKQRHYSINSSKNWTLS